MKLKFKCFLLFLISFKGNYINGLRCYICSDESSFPCLNFDSEKVKFIQQCDRSQKGCLLKTEGNNKTRSCVDKKIDDCKMANGVEYCFCSSDLCNDSSSKFSGITDDEDLIEGSGIKIIDVAKVKPNTVQSNPMQNTTVVYVRSSGITSTSCLYLPLFSTIYMFF